MNKFKLSTIAASLLCAGLIATTLGCEQDPFASYPQGIKNAVPPSQKPGDGRPAVPQDALVIGVNPSVINFVEEVKGEIQVEARIVGYEVEYDIIIEGLPEGAVFDVDTGLISWRPSRGYVKGGAHMNVSQLAVTLVTRTNPPVIRTERFNMTVYRQKSEPIITSISSIGTMKEGEQREIMVVVRDLNSYDGVGSDTYAPQLFVQKNKTVNDVSNNVYLLPPSWNRPNPEQDKADPFAWRYRMRVDLSGIELTKTTTTAYFSLMAMAHTGNVSKQEHIQFTVQTASSAPIITWAEDRQTITEGELFAINFDVYTEQGDGLLNVVFDPACNTLPGQAVCSCANVKNNSAFLRCKFQWRPANTTKRTQDIRIHATNTNRFDQKDFKKTSSLNSFTVKIAETSGASND